MYAVGPIPWHPLCALPLALKSYLTTPLKESCSFGNFSRSLDITDLEAASSKGTRRWDVTNSRS